MAFFGLGIWEILLILLMALIIWGPGKLPEIAKILGQIVCALRKATFDLTTAVTKELDIEGKDYLSHSRANSGDKTRKLSGVDTTEPGSTETASPRDH